MFEFFESMVATSGDIDYSKRTVIVFAGGDIWGSAYSLDGWFQVQHSRYRWDDIQVVYFGSKQSRGRKWIQFNTQVICKHTKRQAEDDHATEYNRAILYQLIELTFGKFKQIEEMWALGAKGQFILPLQPIVKKADDAYLNSRMNEFHDYVGVNETILNSIEKHVEIAKQNLFNGLVSATGFSTIHTRVNMQAWEWICKTRKPRTYSFIIDPSCFYPGFEWGQPHTNYYFADDDRGTRNFKASPFDWWQHERYDSSRKSTDTLSAFFELEKPKKDRKLLFAGSIMYDKGTRVSKWDWYLKRYLDSDSAFHIPLRANGVNQSKSENPSQIANAQRKHSTLWKEIANHPLYRPAVLPDKLVEIADRYRYMLVLACVSLEDSLNFRPVFCVMHGILPLLDPRFDPDCLMIPGSIQRQLLVRDWVEMENRIRYFEENPLHRDQLLVKLKDHLNKRNHFDDV